MKMKQQQLYQFLFLLAALMLNQEAQCQNNSSTAAAANNASTPVPKMCGSTVQVPYGPNQQFTSCCGGLIPYNITTERCCVNTVQPFCFFSATDVNNYSCCGGTWSYSQVTNLYQCNGVYPLSGPCRFNVGTAGK